MGIGYIYILTNRKNGVLYVGVTSDLIKRVYQHKTHLLPFSFTAKYNCTHLVYYEELNTIKDAILREKQLKNWKRDWKIALIEKENPDWNDLYYALCD